jgi:hypothetical protein
VSQNKRRIRTALFLRKEEKMTRTIITKYNIGDAVFAAESYYVYVPNSKPYIVSGIEVKINTKTIRISYEIEQEGITHRFPEDWLFSTHEECVQWCKEHN